MENSRYTIALRPTLVCGLLGVVCAAFAAFAAAFAGSGSAASRTDADAATQRALDAYGNNILRFAYSYLHNMSDAEDVLQETLIKYLQARPAFAGKAHEKAWLLRVTGNLSKNKLNYNRVRSSDELNEELIAEERDDLSFVWEAVRELPVKYREAIHLFYYEGYTTAQIAKLLREEESTVRSQLHRGRGMLKTILKEAYDFE